MANTVLVSFPDPNPFLLQCWRWSGNETNTVPVHAEHKHMSHFTLMTTGTFSQNVDKLFSKLELVTDNFSLYLCHSQLRSHWKIKKLSHKSLGSSFFCAYIYTFCCVRYHSSFVWWWKFPINDTCMFNDVLIKAEFDLKKIWSWNHEVVLICRVTTN